MRIRAVRADAIRRGDVLWSDATMRELLVVGAGVEQARADGNLYADPEDRPRATTRVVVLEVIDRAGRRQRLGGFAPQARLQVVA